MLTSRTKAFRSVMIYGVMTLIAASAVAFAQDSSADPQQAPPAAPGWHRFSAPPPPSSSAPSAPPQAPEPQADPVPPPAPRRVTIPAGAFVTVRVDQLLSSEKNKAGDAFSATLSRPVVAGGLVVARRGETLGGEVVEAKKAGRVKGVSQLHIALNSLTLADGRQVPIDTELTNITGPTSKARDAGAILATTTTGAAIGAAAAWGPGAAIGGGAGLLAGAVGVLVTRGHATVIYPESQLTFRLSMPVTFSTDRDPQAFADASTLNTQRAALQGTRQSPPPAYQGCNGPGCTPAPYPPPYYGPYYPYYYPYWGPGFGLYFGPGFYGRGFRR